MNDHLHGVVTDDPWGNAAVGVFAPVGLVSGGARGALGALGALGGGAAVSDEAVEATDEAWHVIVQRLGQQGEAQAARVGAKGSKLSVGSASGAASDRIVDFYDDAGIQHVMWAVKNAKTLNLTNQISDFLAAAKPGTRASSSSCAATPTCPGRCRTPCSRAED